MAGTRTAGKMRADGYLVDVDIDETTTPFWI